MARSRLVLETMPIMEKKKKKASRREMLSRKSNPWPSLAQPKEGRSQGDETKREEPWTTTLSTRYTQQTSPYALTK